jgi:protocatechuate 3,4-dioxygenase beta subunit
MKNMRQFLLSSLIFILGINVFAQNENTITISGQVTDFDGNPIDSCFVRLCHKNFSTAYKTYSDKTGHYVLENVKKGDYLALMAIRPEEYPRPVFVNAPVFRNGTPEIIFGLASG